jgi:hypothetical protein
MFNKKECSACGKKIKNDYEFCPFCGHKTNSKTKDFGMLGKEDSPETIENFAQNIFGGFGGGILNKMINSTMKMLEKEMQKEMREQQKNPRTNMQLFINGKKIDLPNMNEAQKPMQNKKQKINSVHFTSANQEKFASLKQKEPTTSIKRLGDTILYEISLPNVKSIKDISIVKLESSVEIKAISKSIAYFKTIPINLDLAGYQFSEGKLIIEFID